MQPRWGCEKKKRTVPRVRSQSLATLGYLNYAVGVEERIQFVGVAWPSLWMAMCSAAIRIRLAAHSLGWNPAHGHATNINATTPTLQILEPERIHQALFGYPLSPRLIQLDSESNVAGHKEHTRDVRTSDAFDNARCL
jgi:hypothetical protein